MDNPMIQSFTRPIYENDQNDMGAVNLAEQKFFVGAYFAGIKMSAVNIPEAMGRLVTNTIQPGQNPPIT